MLYRKILNNPPLCPSGGNSINGLIKIHRDLTLIKNQCLKPLPDFIYSSNALNLDRK